MVETQVKQVEQQLPDNRAGYMLVVAQFLFTWLGFLVLLMATALIMNIDWARPKFEQMMSESLKREVKLGPLAWNLSLNGLAVSTARMTVKEKNGGPFLNAGPSEIGVAFLPLVEGKLIIHHLSFTRPELWAERIAGDVWNFSDLLECGPDIRFIQVERGRFHVRDTVKPETGEQSTGHFPPYLLENVAMKLAWPRKARSWPFYVSFDMPKGSHTTRVKLTTLGSGLLADWQHNKYRFDLNVDKLDPRDVRAFIPVADEVRGLFTFKAHGEGILDNGIKADADVRVEQLSVATPEFGEMKAPSAAGSVELSIGSKRIGWEDATLDAGEIRLTSTGSLSNWQAKVPSYKAHIDAHVKDVSALPPLIASATEAGPDSLPGMVQSVNAMLRDKSLSGKAVIAVDVTGTGDSARYATEITTEGISARDLAERGPFKNRPWLNLIGLDPQSRLRGHVRIGTDERVELDDVELVSGPTTFKATGFWDQHSGQSEIKLASTSVSLDGLQKRMGKSPDYIKAVKEFFAVSSPSLLKLGGQIDLSGQLAQEAGQRHLDLVTHLKNASLTLTDGSLSATSLTGSVIHKNNLIVLDQIKGKLGDGDFTLAGTITSGARRHVDVNFRATHLSLDELDRALELCRIDFPILVDRQLSGRVKEFALSIKGDPDEPKIRLVTVPEDLNYQPPGLTRPLKAVSGTIVYEGDELTLKDVALVSQGNRLVTNLAIERLCSTARLKRLKVKTTGVELADVHYYLASPLMPAALRKGYLDTLARLKISSLHGKVYGDALWLIRPDNDFDFDGVIGFFGAGVKAGNEEYPIERLSGILAASGRELLLQDITGSIGRSQFAVDGHITNYRSAQALWQADLRAKVLPAELLQLVPGLAEGINAKVISSGPLSVKANVTGNQKASTIIFSARAGERDNLHIETPFGALYQPRGQAVTIDGSMTLTPGEAGSLKLNDSHVLIGDALIQTQGTYSWYKKASGKGPTLSGSVFAPNPIPAATLVAVLDPATKLEGVKGYVSGKGSAAGPLSRLSADGYIDFDSVSLPSFNLFNLTGRAETQEFLIAAMSGSELVDLAGHSRAKLNLKSVSVGELTAKDIVADIFVEPSHGQANSPRVGLSKGTAKVAGGEVDLAGWVDLSQHRIHVDLRLAKVSADQVVTRLLGHPGEISGVGESHIVLDSQGTEYQEIIRNLSGHGEIIVKEGKVTRFGKLQEKLTQANLIQQGLFGFNLNNLLQSVAPVRTGEFKSLSGHFKIDDGLLSLDEVKFNGEDMRLRAAGSVNLPSSMVKIEVAGNLPRVSSSLISGAIGDVSREFTIQKLLSLFTFHKLESLPPLPILGEIASDQPRAFTFQVSSSFDKPNLIAQSIEKSFRWLPNHANASAHPVPGMD